MYNIKASSKFALPKNVIIATHQRFLFRLFDDRSLSILALT